MPHGVDMESIKERLLDVRRTHEPQSKQNWQRQQDYYQRLKKEGVAKLQTYNLAPAASL